MNIFIRNGLFEQKILGLEPNKSNDGLHLFKSSAGGASGSYPIESFEKILASGRNNSHTLQHTISDNPGGVLIVRYHDLLIPVSTPTICETRFFDCLFCT